MLLRPMAQQAEWLKKRCAQRSKRILDSWRNDGECPPLDNSVALKAAQRLSQYFVRNLFNNAVKLTVPESARRERMDYHEPPLARHKVNNQLRFQYPLAQRILVWYWFHKV